MTAHVDLVADVGEGFGAYRMADDAGLLDLVTSANIACGFHAGDPVIMDQTVRACHERGVAVGAHPGFHDLAGFGRRAVELSAAEIRAETLYQLGALDGFARAHGTRLRHVTPHGRLGNLCVTDAAYANGVLDAVEAFDPTLPVVTQSGELSRLARERGFPVAITCIADRAYNADGSLVDRRREGAVIHDANAMVERVLRMVIDRTVVTIDGVEVEMDFDTVLIHGDNPASLGLARRIRDELIAQGVTLAPLATVLAARGEGP
ncbi:LamB/YcsF family protein [Dactylosporangium sp. CA-233914]|uniref:LamB/YcsF family protein n=1 Tax=Dactylosporangium sp. CA-233914 TaxID=3239934 RepID=UPI003D8C4AFF